jgi:hypothetical protein
MQIGHVTKNGVSVNGRKFPPEIPDPRKNINGRKIAAARPAARRSMTRRNRCPIPVIVSSGNPGRDAGPDMPGRGRAFSSGWGAVAIPCANPVAVPIEAVIP